MTELLGYLPQDLEKRSFIKFIHLDDLEKIKQIHCDSKFKAFLKEYITKKIYSYSFKF